MVNINLRVVNRKVLYSSPELTFIKSSKIIGTNQSEVVQLVRYCSRVVAV